MNKYKIIIISIILLFALILFGCSENGNTLSTRYADIQRRYLIYIDSETGVEYFANNHSICPRFHADGSLYVE